MSDTRRKFIKDLAIFAGVLTAAPQILYGKPKFNSPAVTGINAPIPWGAIIAVAKFAIESGGLFKGTSSSGISDLQIQMFENISKQLKVIQDSLTLILANLAEVKKVLDEVPAKVASELNDKNLQGQIGVYEELMRVYVGYTQNRQNFLDDNNRVRNLTRIVETIGDLRQVLFTFKNYLNIPILSTALYVEYNCLNLLKENQIKIDEAMKSYGIYFQEILHGGNSQNLKKRIEDLRNERAKLIKQISTIELFDSKIINPNFTQSHYLVSGYYKFDTQLDYETDKDLINNMLSLGLITDDERLMSVKQIIKARTNGGLGNGSCEVNIPRHDPNYGKQMVKNCTPFSVIPLYTDEINRINKLQTDLDEKINLNTYQIYSTVSCYYAGNRALEFCRQF